MLSFKNPWPILMVWKWVDLSPIYELHFTSFNSKSCYARLHSFKTFLKSFCVMHNYIGKGVSHTLNSISRLAVTKVQHKNGHGSKDRGPTTITEWLMCHMLRLVLLKTLSWHLSQLYSIFLIFKIETKVLQSLYRSKFSSNWVNRVKLKH